jgi:hypothetical protein
MAYEGGSFSSCAAGPGSTILTTPARPCGTATTRTTSLPLWASGPAVSLPQHPSTSEPLEGIPTGAHEGSRPAPVIGDNRRSGLPRTHDRTIRTAPAHCPTAPDLGCLVGFSCPLTPPPTAPAPWAAALAAQSTETVITHAACCRCRHHCHRPPRKALGLCGVTVGSIARPWGP